MIIPRHVYSTALAPRQAVLPTEFATATDETTTKPKVTDDTDTSPQTTRTTTIASTLPSAPSSTSSDTGILAQAKATTNLSWWQLLCIALGGVLLLSILMWAIWRTKSRKNKETKRAREVEAEEEKRVKEILEQRRAGEGRKERHGRKGSGSTFSGISSEWTSSEESYDSVSDGGTIVPRRRRTRRRRGRDRPRGRRRDRRRYDDYSSEDSDWSDETRYNHRASRDRYHQRGRERHRHRRFYTPTPSPSPTPVPGGNQRKRFRDSVFSTYASMKQAAVQLKVVEAKVKLKKQLEEEERIERARQEKTRKKVVEANREIERHNQAPSANSDRPLIPPAPGRQSSVASSFRTPPPRSARRGPSSDSISRVPPALGRKSNDHDELASQATANPEADKDTRPPQTGFGAEIRNLLGGKKPTQPVTRQQPEAPLQPARAKVKKQATIQNDFQADWLSHPNPSMSVPQSPSHSVYLPVTKPKDRPTIPPGSLAPAPPPKVRLKSGRAMGMSSEGLGPSQPIGALTGGESGQAVDKPNISGKGAAGGKWADRLRARK